MQSHDLLAPLMELLQRLSSCVLFFHESLTRKHPKIHTSSGRINIAYSVFALLSIADDNQKLLLLSGLSALFGTLAHRVYTMHSRKGALMVNRVMIFGSGPEARDRWQGTQEV